MLKATYEALSLAIPKQELVSAAKRFLLDSDSNRDLILLDNIDSPKFGSSDLLFINKAKTDLTLARLNDRADCERFVISAISYYFWLNESIRVDEILFDRKSRLEMYLFSPDFSPAICYLVDNLSKKYGVHLVKYNIFQVEDLDEPAINFQHITLKGPAQDKPTSNISPQELSEFYRLKEHYLD